MDWNTILRPGMRGVVVEGPDDKRIIEAFLDAGTRIGLWDNWTLSLRIEVAGNFEKVIRELSDSANAGVVWGIVDRDWRTSTEVSQLQLQYPQLLFLPRIMIDNFYVDPDELLDLLPPTQRSGIDESLFRSQIERYLAEWIKHGALSRVLYENGAHQFCRGNTGYPKRLIDTLITDEQQIATILDQWRTQLDSQIVLSNFRTRISDFQQYPRHEQYRSCINGKIFFNQVIIPQILNRFFGQADRDTWLVRLFVAPNRVPNDLEAIFRKLVL
jgi:hypothetical protein